VSEQWKPNAGQPFWVWRNDNTAQEHIWEDKMGQVHCYEEGNVHPTKEAAEAWGAALEKTRKS
jgi:hypothetical protein